MLRRCAAALVLVVACGAVTSAQLDKRLRFVVAGTSSSPTEYYLEDADWKSATNGLGPVEKGRSNGTIKPDGPTLLIAGGVTFTNGLGVFATSEICYPVPTTVTGFKATVGVDDAVGSGGSVRFVIESPNNTERYRSAALTGASANVDINLALTSPTEVCLRMEDNGDGSTNDMGVWGNPRIVGADVTPLCDVATVNVTAGSSIASAITTAGANGIICLENGTHRITASLVPLNGQTLVGRSVSGPTIIGSRLLTSWTQTGSNYFATGQTQAGATNYYAATAPNRPEDFCGNATDMGLTASPRCYFPEDTFLDGVRLNHVASLATCDASGEWFFDYAADRIYICGQNPNGHTVETTVVDEITSGTGDSVRILHLSYKYFASPLLRYTMYGGSDWRIEDIDCSWTHGACANALSGWIVRNSRLHDNGEYGIGGDGGSSLVEGNEVDGNGWSGLSEYWGVGGSKFAGKDGNTVRNNNSHDNRGPGFWSDTGESINTIYEDNVLQTNARAGIMHEYSGSAIIRNNWSIGNGTRATFDGGTSSAQWLQNGCLEILDSVNVEAYGNVCVDNKGAGISVLEDTRGHNVASINIHDNITAYTTNPGVGFGRSGYGDTGGTDALAEMNFHDNTYCIPTGSQTYFQVQNSTFSNAGLSDAAWIALSTTTNETIVRSADCSAYTVAP